MCKNDEMFFKAQKLRALEKSRFAGEEREASDESSIAAEAEADPCSKN